MHLEDSPLFRVQVHHRLIGLRSLEIGPRDNLAEVRNAISQSTLMHLYQNYHFEADGKHLPQFAEVAALLQPQSRLEIILDPFDERTSRTHLTKVTNLLSQPLLYIGLLASSTTSPAPQTEPPRITLEDFTAYPFTSPIRSMNHPNRQVAFRDLLFLSGFNPPPLHRRAAGDLYYLLLHTPEQLDYHITACPSGFYVNSSTFNSFQPQPLTIHSQHSSLLQLIKSLSNSISQSLSTLFQEAKLGDIERMQIFSQYAQSVTPGWLAPNKRLKHHWHTNPEDSHTVSDEQPPIKEWNEMFFAHRSLPTDKSVEKLNKEKIKSRLWQEFEENAKQGVKALIEQTIEPVLVTKRGLVFSYSSVYLSYLTDGKTDNASASDQLTVSQIEAQLSCLSQMQPWESDYFCQVHSIIVRYRGHCVLAQSFPVYHLAAQATPQQMPPSFLNNLSKAFHRNEDEVRVARLQFVIASKRCYIRNLHCLNYIQKQDKGIPTIFYRPELVKAYKETHSNNLKPSLSLGSFLNFCAVPACLKSLEDEMRRFQADSLSLTAALRRHGLQDHHLGLLDEKCNNKTQSHLKRNIRRVIIVKVITQVISRLLRKAPNTKACLIISQVINRLLGLPEHETQSNQELKGDSDGIVPSEMTVSLKKKKKKHRELMLSSMETVSLDTGFQLDSPKQIQNEVNKIAAEKFNYCFPISLEQFRSSLSYQSRLAILRDVCLSVGIILQVREYGLPSQMPTYIQLNPQNIVRFCCVTPSSFPLPVQLSHLIVEADVYFQHMQLQRALQVYHKATQIAHQCLIGSHPTLPMLYKRTSQIYFRLGQFETALSYAYHCCQILEITHGQDHFETIDTYSLLGIYNYHRKSLGLAEYYLIKSVALARFSFTDSYPQVLVGLMNLAATYQIQKRIDDALIIAAKTIVLSESIYGSLHSHSAICHAAAAAVYIHMPDVKHAIQRQKQAIDILRRGLADESRIKEAQIVLQYYNSLLDCKKLSKDKGRSQTLMQIYAAMTPMLSVAQQVKEREREELQHFKRDLRGKKFGRIPFGI